MSIVIINNIYNSSFLCQFIILLKILREISEVPFELEKNIQYIVEHNIKTIFNLDFVTSEFELNGLRIGFYKLKEKITQTKILL